MALSYESTRGGQKGVTASQAILKGLAEDGGLFMPTELPKLDKTLEQLAGMTYQETAYEVMKLFLTDYTEEELKTCIANAYDSKFDTEEIAPLAKADGAYFLELYHGSTIAFKDMALSILPHIGRLVPQVVYYVYAYAKLLENEQIENGEEINVVVPTGNFGNILAAYFAKHMGVPIKTLICASNDNKVLYDFFTTGTYDRKREFILTNSPSMDILISSNLERLIYLSTGCDAAADAALMKDLSEKGSYTVTGNMRQFMSDFRGGFATEAQNEATIRKIFEDTGYLIDTHTGVAATVYNAYKAETGDQTKTVIASTASPYKFSHSVLEAIKGKSAVEGKDEFAVVDELSEVSGTPVPKAVEELRSAVIRHNTECDVDKMGETVKNILGIA